MCTIGAVLDGEEVYLYKQCDLTVKKDFYEPRVRYQRFPYLAMTREGRPGLWAGMNAEGVSFVAADAYTNATYQIPDDAVNALFNAYENAVGNAATAREAANILEKFYRSGYGGTLFPGPDIALFADGKEAVFIEFTPGPNHHDPVREIVISSGFFASTNHFRIQPDAVIYGANHSTYLRLDRSQIILEKEPNLRGIKTLLTDRYYGSSELSICRKAQYGGEYFTQATAVFGCRSLSCDYQVNGNPVDNPLRPFDPGTWSRRHETMVPPLHCEPAQLDIRHGRHPVPPPPGFLYVGQANYALVPMFQKDGPRYLYSDSATSCIIVIGTGRNLSGQWIASIAHLDSEACIEAYFSDVLDKTYRGPVSIFAQGANPPGDKCSHANAETLRKCLSERSTGQCLWTPEIRHLGLEEGDPRRKDRGDYGISIAPEVPIVSTQPFALELSNRDATGGVQTLFCIMRRQMNPPIQLRDALTPFDPDLVAQLVDIAAVYHKDDPKKAFTEIINLTTEEVLTNWSTTPQYESPWFSDELKQSCSFTRVYLASRRAVSSGKGSGDVGTYLSNYTLNV